MPLNLFYTMVQKSQKWPKTQIKGGGPALNNIFDWQRPSMGQNVLKASTLFAVWTVKGSDNCTLQILIKMILRVCKILLK